MPDRSRTTVTGRGDGTLPRCTAGYWSGKPGGNGANRAGWVRGYTINPNGHKLLATRPVDRGGCRLATVRPRPTRHRVGPAPAMFEECYLRSNRPTGGEQVGYRPPAALPLRPSRAHVPWRVPLGRQPCRTRPLWKPARRLGFSLHAILPRPFECAHVSHRRTVARHELRTPAVGQCRCLARGPGVRARGVALDRARCGHGHDCDEQGAFRTGTAALPYPREAASRMMSAHAHNAPRPSPVSLE